MKKQARDESFLTRGEVAEFQRLQKTGQAWEAFELATRLHQRVGTPVTGKMYLDTLTPALDFLLEKQDFERANPILSWLLKNHSDRAKTWKSYQKRFEKFRPDPSEWILPLVKPESFSPESRTSAEEHLRSSVFDLDEVLKNPSLPTDHPLRLAAQALSEAFRRVTSGPVSLEDLSLPEVSRKSPLAPWKLLVQAIAVLYAKDQPRLEKLLEKIPPDSAPARLVPALRSLQRGKAGPQLSPPSNALVNQALGRPPQLVRSVERIKEALKRDDQKSLERSLRMARKAWEEFRPEMVPEFTRRVMVLVLKEGPPSRALRRCLPITSPPPSSFWAFWARTCQEDGDLGWMLLGWERYLDQLRVEAPDRPDDPRVVVGLEEVLITLERAPTSLVKQGAKGLEHELPEILPCLYPAPIPPVKKVLASVRDLLDVSAVYRLLITLAPSPERFLNWWGWAQVSRQPVKLRDEILEQWRVAFPRDITPLVQLVRSAEARGALQKAQSYLKLAEALDGMRPDVRRARLRLVFQEGLRHLARGKPHLVDKDLRALAALPGMGEGLRPALDPALRVLRALSSGDKETERQESERLLEVLPNPACRDLLLVALMASAKIKPGKKWKPPRGPELLSGTAQALALLDEVGGPLLLPEDWTLALLKELKKSGKAAASSDLKRIAGVASQLETPKPTELAYACTRIGLSRRDQELPGFLLLRARQLDYWDVDRLINCLRMTHELARRRQDQALLEEIREVALEICPEAFEGPENPIMVPLSESELSSLLKQEQAAPRQRYPSLKRPGRETLAPFLRYLIEGDDDGDEEECDCPACRARRSGGNHFDDLDEFEDEMDPFDFLEAVLPRPRAPSGAERKNLKQKRKNAKRTRQANRKKKKK